jgi:hypothetical protein
MSSPPQGTKLAQRPVLDGPNAMTQTEAISSIKDLYASTPLRLHSEANGDPKNKNKAGARMS